MRKYHDQAKPIANRFPIDIFFNMLLSFELYSSAATRTSHFRKWPYCETSSALRRIASSQRAAHHNQRHSPIAKNRRPGDARIP